MIWGLFVELFPAVEEFEDFVAVVVFEELAFLLVGDAAFLELSDVVGFLREEDYAVNALACHACGNGHDLVGWRNGVPGFVGSADVEVHHDWLLEEALVATGDGFPVPRGRVGFAEHGDDEVIRILCHSFEVVAEPYLTQQRVGETIHEQRLARYNFFNFSEEVGDCFGSPLHPAEAAFGLFFDASGAGAEALVCEVLAADADARRNLGGFCDDF